MAFRAVGYLKFAREPLSCVLNDFLDSCIAVENTAQAVFAQRDHPQLDRLLAFGAVGSFSKYVPQNVHWLWEQPYVICKM